jgi:twitching motility protein PilT
MDIIDVLTTAAKRGASDIIFSVGYPPMVRYHGDLVPHGNDPLDPDLAKRLIYSILNDEQKIVYEEHRELDLSIAVKNIGRFRVNVFRQQGNVGAAFRIIMSDIPTLDRLKVPPVFYNIAKLPRGLVLVTGPTGSGKSTLLAAFLDHINSGRRAHIVTIEDPIEFVHPRRLSCVSQREIGKDSLSFTNALKYVLRQNPDVIMLGEMRDLETIAAALTLAETGHLVFSTLHTQSAAQTVDRIVDVFPPYQQQQIRVQLSLTLQAVICQILLPSTDGFSRVPAREIMVTNPATANLMREGKTHMLFNVIETSAADGMITMDRSIQQLLGKGEISQEVARAKVTRIKL